jgi:hypothetical protein
VFIRGPTQSASVLIRIQCHLAVLRLPSRKLIGAWHGAAVRLGKLAVDRLHLATGVLAGLQARGAFPAILAWIAGPTSAMAHLALPAEIRDVVVIGPDGRVTVRFANSGRG